jgi:hypothetical protein
MLVTDVSFNIETIDLMWDHTFHGKMEDEDDTSNLDESSLKTPHEPRPVALQRREDYLAKKRQSNNLKVALKKLIKRAHSDPNRNIALKKSIKRVHSDPLRKKNYKEIHLCQKELQKIQFGNMDKDISSIIQRNFRKYRNK